MTDKAKKTNVVKIPRLILPILPPEGWDADTPYGFLGARTPEGQDIDLARLVDVWEWLRTKGKKISKKRALGLLIEGLERGIEEGVYGLQETDSDAVLLNPKTHYIPHTVPIMTPHGKRFREDEPDNLTLEKTAVYVLRHLLGSGFDLKERYAVPMAAAYAAWGYGRIAEAPAVDTAPIAAEGVSEWETLVTYRKNVGKGESWTNDHRVILSHEHKRRLNAEPHKTKRKIETEMALELGLTTPQSVTYHLKQIGHPTKREKARERLTYN